MPTKLPPAGTYAITYGAGYLVRVTRRYECGVYVEFSDGSGELKSADDLPRYMKVISDEEAALIQLAGTDPLDSGALVEVRKSCPK